jgi:IMP dehydrogenase
VEGLTFDDVLLVPPSRPCCRTTCARDAADQDDRARDPDRLAAMDTVTEARLAIALAREGGIGILHRNLSIADQVAEVDKVKRSESG